MNDNPIRAIRLKSADRYACSVPCTFMLSSRAVTNGTKSSRQMLNEGSIRSRIDARGKNCLRVSPVSKEALPAVYITELKKAFTAGLCAHAVRDDTFESFRDGV